MKFSYSAVWADVIALLRAHGSLIATVAGVFMFLPILLLAYVAPQPGATTFEELIVALGGYWRENWLLFLLQALVSMVGSVAILKLIFVRDITVGGAIAAAAALLPFYFLATLLSSLVIGLGFLLLILPGLYLIGRLAPLGPVVVAEDRRNPIDAITRTFALTKGRGWAILGFLLIVFIAAAIVLGVAAMLLGILFIAVAGREVGELLSMIVGAGIDAAVLVLLLLLDAAIYRAVAAAPVPADGASTTGS